jgi:hypothetical protein
MGQRRAAYRVLVGKPEGNRPLGIRMCRWKDIIKMDLQEIGWESMDCVYLALNRDKWQNDVNAVMKL